MVAVAYFGCSGESVVPTEFEQVNTTGVVRGEINPGDVAFEFVIEGSGANPLVGPFVLRGSNVHYVDSLSALSVDLTIDNDGQATHPEPIGLTFVSFMPAEVTLTNPDNGENGPGAAIVFEFDNDDNHWTPGEESLPRTTLLGVADGVSIGFVAHVDIPQDTASGTIGGVVWNDVNEDGVMDNDEPGIGGVVVYLVTGDDPQVKLTDDDYKMRTVTGRDGSYRFDGLAAGYYQVIKDFMDPKWRPTTPTVISVILVEKDGVVSDFLLANFGQVMEDLPPPPEVIEVGDYVEVNGEYVDEGDGRLMAHSIEVCSCDNPPPPDSMLVRSALHMDGDENDDDDDNDDCDDWDHDHDWDKCRKLACWGLKNELRGPVTDIDRENCQVEIMGTWVHVALCDTASNDTIPVSMLTDGGGDDHDGDRKHFWLDLDDIEIGDRVWARVFTHKDDDMLFAFWLKEWKGTKDKVHGIVEAVSPPSGPLEYIEVLGVMIVITADTEKPRD